MDNINFTSSSPMSSKPENKTRDTVSLHPCYGFPYVNVFSRKEVFCILMSVPCILGLVGNGTVIWLLGFRMKRTPFTTYILNLAVADFGVLIALVFMLLIYMGIHFDFGLLHGFEDLFLSLFFYLFFDASQFLLITISIDRCVVVLFPIWYRCHRPKKTSTVLCALIWLLTFLFQGICLVLRLTSKTGLIRFYAYLVTPVVCLPLITVSTLILFVRFCFKSQQRQRGKLLMAILLALFFFLIFAFPLTVVHLIRFNPNHSEKDDLNIYCYGISDFSWLSVSLNSFVNPLLYFLVGRKKRNLCRENLKHLLRRVFMEEEEELSREV